MVCYGHSTLKLLSKLVLADTLKAVICWLPVFGYPICLYVISYTPPYQLEVRKCLIAIFKHDILSLLEHAYIMAKERIYTIAMLSYFAISSLCICSDHGSRTVLLNGHGIGGSWRVTSRIRTYMPNISIPRQAK